MKMNAELPEAKAKLKAKQWKSTGTKLMWGTGGITVGGLVMAVLMLVGK